MYLVNGFMRYTQPVFSEFDDGNRPWSLLVRLQIYQK